jgi:hypothetical protein
MAFFSRWMNNQTMVLPDTENQSWGVLCEEGGCGEGSWILMQITQWRKPIIEATCWMIICNDKPWRHHKSQWLTGSGVRPGAYPEHTGFQAQERILCYCNVESFHYMFSETGALCNSKKEPWGQLWSSCPMNDKDCFLLEGDSTSAIGSACVEQGIWQLWRFWPTFLILKLLLKKKKSRQL